jgi:hypothetical protein
MITRVIMAVIIMALTVWLVGAARSPGITPGTQVLLAVLAVILPLHLILWQLGGVKLLDRMRSWPKPIIAAATLLMLASSPMVLYPLGLLAVVLAAFAGGIAGPALAVTGTVMLLPIFLLVGIALLFVISGYKGG